ncbi:MAG: hypothetical protein K2G30_07905, partial [Muribaculaceae bacterium]|nr:hypothetical protein [Muribaculaceae bacterium]
MRKRLAALCASPLGREEVGAMAFMTDFSAVERALLGVSEMMAATASDEGFPLGGLSDITPVLKRARVEGSAISVDELRQVRRTLQTFADVSSFLARSRGEDGTTPYPVLCAEAEALETFPEVTREIDRVVDQNGNIRDN